MHYINSTGFFRLELRAALNVKRLSLSFYEILSNVTVSGAVLLRSGQWSCFGFLSEFSTKNGKKCAKSVEVLIFILNY